MRVSKITRRRSQKPLADREIMEILGLLEAIKAPPLTPPPHVLARLRAKVRQVFGKGAPNA